LVRTTAALPAGLVIQYRTAGNGRTLLAGSREAQHASYKDADRELVSVEEEVEEKLDPLQKHRVNWFREPYSEAGLSHCTALGLAQTCNDRRN
jgi:hypothetical protein